MHHIPSCSHRHTAPPSSSCVGWLLFFAELMKIFICCCYWTTTIYLFSIKRRYFFFCSFSSPFQCSSRCFSSSSSCTFSHFYCYWWGVLSAKNINIFIKRNIHDFQKYRLCCCCWLLMLPIAHLPPPPTLHRMHNHTIPFAAKHTIHS